MVHPYVLRGPSQIQELHVWQRQVSCNQLNHTHCTTSSGKQLLQRILFSTGHCAAQNVFLPAVTAIQLVFTALRL